MNSIIKIICGPTASGKSARAIDIAQSAGGVIINADAMQVYRELRILTARPAPEQEAAAPHLLYGVMSAADSCSVARWLKLARAAIDDTLARGALPVVTGGTGLYIRALMQGLSAIPDIPPEARAQAKDLWEKHGAEALRQRDPVMSARLKEGDTQRHIRALEVVLATGKSLAYWQASPREKPYPAAKFDVEYMDVPRAELYERCNDRFLRIMEAGALAEVQALRAQNLPATLPAMRAVGVAELAGHLEGKWSFEEAIARAQQATRNYAKRQVTWFKHH